MSLTSSPEYYLTELGQKISLLNNRLDNIDKKIHEITIINKRLDRLEEFIEALTNIKLKPITSDKN